MKTYQYHASSIRTDLTGEEDAGLVTFRAIPYASVSKRWTQSCTQHSLPSPFDATNFLARDVPSPMTLL